MAFVHGFILFIEAAGLVRNLLWAPAVIAPTIAHQRESASWNNMLDLWAPVKSKALGPCILWSITNWILPSISAYFFNMTCDVRVAQPERQYLIDPFVFSIVKALLAYGAYSQSATDVSFDDTYRFSRGGNLGWDLYSRSAVGAVRDNILGGYHGLQMSAFIGILVSLYDAVLQY